MLCTLCQKQLSGREERIQMINTLNKQLELHYFDSLDVNTCYTCIVRSANELNEVMEPLLIEKEEVIKEWKKNDAYTLVERGTPEFTIIQNIFNNRNISFTIFRIEKNNNIPLFQKYLERLKKSSKHEKLMFNGSNNRNYNSIMQNGFDIGRANNGLLGKWIYFAHTLHYSDSYTNLLKTEQGDLKNVILARVCFNKYAGDPKYGNCCVFDQNDGYPQYIIYYKT